MCRECDRQHLERTFELARRGAGSVAPNPMVGAVITRDGRFLAEGYHQSYGGLHAEAEALEQVGGRAPGATLFCNLEPCSYTAPDKHQPACTGRIIDAGVRRVVIAQLDPNPRVRGRGVAQLQQAGIEVVIADGDLAEQAWELNESFNTWMALGRPWVQLKAAISLDGRMATADGDSTWITDQAARSRAHAMRARVDAVVVGRGTLEADDPLLTTRLVEGPDARPVVVDTRLRIDNDAQLLRTRARELILCVAHGVLRDSGAARAAELRARGVTILPVKPSPSGVGLDPLDLLQQLGGHGLRSLLVEGGGALITSLVAAGAYDRISLFVAPVLIGAGVPLLGDVGVRRIAEAQRPAAPRWEQIGTQQLLSARHPLWLERVTRACGRELDSSGQGALPADGCSEEHYDLHRDRPSEVEHVYRAG